MAQTRSWRAQAVGCVHCGMCTESCHYVLANPQDPTFAPAYKADQLRKFFKRHYDWTGRVFPWWVKARSLHTDEDLEQLKDIAFGKCTNCRRCTLNCPMGVDIATLNRLTRGLLTHVGVMPEGVAVVSKDQWEIGNQMGVLREDYLETLEWVGEELQDELQGFEGIPVDTMNADVVFAINPREVKYDPRSISDAAKIFHHAGESWTMPSEGWDMTNFGLFSGDDELGGAASRRLFEKVAELKGKRLVISECGHGYRSTRCEGQNWSQMDVAFEMESHVLTMMRYIDEGRIRVDRSRNNVPVTFHDSCNNARSCGFYEEPRQLLNMVVTDFREMYPNRAENYCCTGGGGAMSMPEYTPRRLKSARIKAEQLKATGAKVVVTSCHNCVDGLSDLIKHYKLDMQVTQLVNLVAEALVPAQQTKHFDQATPGTVEPEVKPQEELPLTGYTVLVVDDEPDQLVFISMVLEDNGATVLTATDGDTALRLARAEKPDLMTLDLSMPGRSGLEVYGEIRGDPELKRLRVCIVTGRPELRQVLYQQAVLPPEGYLDKPLDEERLLRNVRKIRAIAGARS